MSWVLGSREVNKGEMSVLSRDGGGRRETKNDTLLGHLMVRARMEHEAEVKW